MKVTPYLMLDGRGDEAIEFYKKALGATVDMLMRFSDAPREANCSPDSMNKVMHAALSVGGGTVGDAPGLRLVLPNGTVFDELQFPFDSGPLGHTYWYWTRGLGSEPTTGTWRVEALANGVVTRTHSFRVVR